MFSKFCLIFTLIFLSYSNFVYSNPKNTIGEDQNTVNILNNYFSKQTMVGKANFQFLFWNMYDAKLISESGSYPSNKFALILKYNKDFSKKSVVDETINQLKKQKTFSEKELKEVNALLNKAFREIKKNNKFIGIKNNDEAIFYFQNEKYRYALNWFNRISEKDVPKIELDLYYFNKGYTLFSAKNYKKARPLLEMVKNNKVYIFINICFFNIIFHQL